MLGAGSRRISKGKAETGGVVVQVCYTDQWGRMEDSDEGGKRKKLQRAHGLRGPVRQSETEQGRGLERQKPTQGGNSRGREALAILVLLGPCLSGKFWETRYATAGKLEAKGDVGITELVEWVGKRATWKTRESGYGVELCAFVRGGMRRLGNVRRP